MALGLGRLMPLRGLSIGYFAFDTPTSRPGRPPTRLPARFAGKRIAAQYARRLADMGFIKRADAIEHFEPRQARAATTAASLTAHSPPRRRAAYLSPPTTGVTMPARAGAAAHDAAAKTHHR